MTERIARLREQTLASGGYFVDREWLLSASYARTQGRPPLIRQALAFAHLLDRVPVRILPDELIVGWHPKREVSAQERQRLERRRWRDGGRSELWGRVERELTPAERKALDEGLYTAGFPVGHMTPDYQTVLRLGLRGILRQVGERMAGLPAQDERQQFYVAAAITLRAAIRLSRRYAREAELQAAAEPDPVRREELWQVARNCRRVPEWPARTFWQALQASWFIHLLVAMEAGSSHGCFCPGHVDRYAWPYYQADRAAGRLDDARARELLAAWWLKFNEFEPKGVPQVLIVGGTLPDGSDATNELTWLCLDLCEDLQVLHPALALCVSRNTPAPLLERAVAVMKTGIGFPALFNDDVTIPALMKVGVPFAEAVEYVPGSCVEISVVGKTNPWIASGYINLGKCLREAVIANRGAATFEELFAAYQARVAEVVALNRLTHSRFERESARISPWPFLSTVVSDCLERGVDITAGGARYNFVMPEGVGPSNVADGLYALRTLVFQRREVALEDFAAALEADFAGCEWLQEKIERLPRYGNDDGAPDALMRQVVEHFCAEVAQHKNERGGGYHPGFLCWIMHDELGKRTGATPDGRRGGTPLGDCVGPVQGRDRRGPTAMLRSCTAWDHGQAAIGGLVLNMKFQPRLLASAAGRRQVATLLRTYLELGGFEVQVNVVDRKRLEEAVLHPERHRNLIVRVAGYSAYFTSLSPALQQEIIARTEYVRA